MLKENKSVRLCTEDQQSRYGWPEGGACVNGREGLAGRTERQERGRDEERLQTYIEDKREQMGEQVCRQMGKKRDIAVVEICNDE